MDKLKYAMPTFAGFNYIDICFRFLITALAVTTLLSHNHEYAEKGLAANSFYFL
jgi:hypothetical protein